MKGVESMTDILMLKNFLFLKENYVRNSTVPFKSKDGRV